MDSILVSHLQSNVTLLAPSRRLAASLRAKINAQMAQSQQVWATPYIYALEDWLHALWDQFEIEGMIDKMLLNQTQVLLKFEEIIAQSDIGKTLLRQHQAAKTALEAWDNLHHWMIPDMIHQTPENIDQSAFSHWALLYKKWLDKNQLVDNANFSQLLLPLIINDNKKIVGRISPIQELILYGFEELTPLISHFFNVLTMNHWRVHYQEPTKINPYSMYRAQFSNKDEECYAASNWAKDLLDKGKQNIAIVVPNLADMRSQLDTIFRDTFDPFHVFSPSLEVCPYFNISAATPLIQYPIIFEGINFLKLANSTWQLTDLICVITSPFLKASEEESLARATLTSKIKTQSVQKFTFNKILSLINNFQDSELPVLKSIVEYLSTSVKKLPQKQSYYYWSECFREILSVCGWPGDRKLNSVEYQLVKRFDELFNELILCDNICDEPNYTMALNTLQKLAANVPFQPENKGAPVQILGLLEAAGQVFDHLWIMGMDSEAWPPHATPNPFIPILLQRELKMPHAGAQREMQYAQMVTNRFKESAEEIIFSFAQKEKEKMLSLSALIQDIPMMSLPLNTKQTRSETQWKNNINVQSIQDEIAPPLTDEEFFRGTSRTLSLQAMCPFKAFAELRLKLSKEEPAEIWLQAHQQGTILHDILEEFWQDVQGQEKLLSFNEQELTIKLKNLVEKHLKIQLSVDAPIHYSIVEKNRLLHILLDYLQVEKQRSPFTIMATEKKQSTTLAGVSFSLRLDRIDSFEGGQMIIDYKTGNSFDISDIWGDRPQEPQLPLYYLSNADQEPNALTVIKLQSQGCSFEGISEHATDIPGIKTLDMIKNDEVPKQWQALRSYWQNNLENLALQFKQGHAEVSPLQGQLTCRYCHLKAICRIHESELNDE